MKPINVVSGRSKYLGKQAYLGLGEGTNIIYENQKYMRIQNKQLKIELQRTKGQCETNI